MIQKVSNAPSISFLSLHNVQNSSERNVKRGRNEGVEKWELAGLGERGTNKTVSKCFSHRTGMEIQRCHRDSSSHCLLVPY